MLHHLRFLGGSQFQNITWGINSCMGITQSPLLSFLNNSLASCVVKTTGELNPLDPAALAAATLHVYVSNSSSSTNVYEITLLLTLIDISGRLNWDSVHSIVFDSSSILSGAIQDKVAVVVPMLVT